MWVVSAVDADAVRRWGPMWTELFDGYASQPALAQTWRSWLDGTGTDAALDDLCATVHRGSWRDLTRFLDDASSKEQADVHVTRRTSALAALLYAIGPRRARLLPGFVGSFILAPDELAEALPDIRAACAVGDRGAVESRLADALADSATEPGEVFDALPRRAQWAVDRSMGLISVAQAIL
jgi:hypothetical protein